MIRFLILFCFIVVIASLSGNAQTKLSTGNKKAISLYTEADNYRVRRQYRQAIDLLNQAISRDKNFVEAYYRLGLVYFNMRIYPKAIEQFEKALSLTQDLRIKKVVWFDLGEAYLLNGEYDKSETVLKLFIENEKVNRNKLDHARRNLENATFAIENLKSSGEIMQGPLSDTVNQFVMQYFPVLTADESSLFFTRRTGHSDRHDEDLVVSKRNAKGSWMEPVSISRNINSEMNEGTCTISADGRKLIFTSCPGRDNYGSCDLFESNRIGDEWSVPKNLGPGVNTSGWESQPSLSADGRTLYFVSDRRSGLGMRDIWVSTLDDNETWSKAVNLGPPVNSEFDEMSPFIHVNGRTLFYATNGLKGFGGYDIFFSEVQTGGWTAPQNIGAYINNHDDQFSLFITANGEKGYYSHEETREDGYSYSRIYEVRIPQDKQVRFKSNYGTGVVRDSETSTPLSARIELVELEGNQVVSQVRSDSVSGEYLMVLTQGAEYALYVTRPGYLFKSLNFNYSDVKDFEPVVVDIDLDKVREGSMVVLNNIFFDVDKYELKEKSTVELEKIVRFMIDNPTVRIQISGHTDNTGSADHNKQLSLRRATAVYNYLVRRGIKETRVTFLGYGSDKPIADNTTEQGRQLNRRIEFSILR